MISTARGTVFRSNVHWHGCVIHIVAKPGKVSYVASVVAQDNGEYCKIEKVHKRQHMPRAKSAGALHDIMIRCYSMLQTFRTWWTVARALESS